MVKSKLKYWVIPYMLFLFAGMVFSCWLIIRSIELKFALGLCLGIILIITLLIIMRDFKYIRIDPEKRTICWYSLYTPWGRKAILGNFTGYIVSYEWTNSGGYNTCYLVDSAMLTKLKLSGLIFVNLAELCTATGLPEIKNYRFGFGSYIRLLFTGQIKIEVGKKKKK